MTLLYSTSLNILYLLNKAKEQYKRRLNSAKTHPIKIHPVMVAQSAKSSNTSEKQENKKYVFLTGFWH